MNRRLTENSLAPLHIHLLAKAPVAGYAKTRLTPPLASETAAALARAFLLDTVRLLDEAALGAWTLHFAPAEAETWFQRHCPGARLVPQASGDLGRRLTMALGSGPGPLAVMGADTPDFPSSRLREAAHALHEADGVAVPSADGGYCLLAMRHPQPRLFEDVAWSTSQVLAQTRERAAAAGLSLRELEPWDDVDDLPSLRRLARRLALAPAETAPETRRVLDGLVLDTL